MVEDAIAQVRASARSDRALAYRHDGQPAPMGVVVQDTRLHRRRQVSVSGLDRLPISDLHEHVGLLAAQGVEAINE